MSSTAGPRKLTRRVADSDRRRALVSCDRCKTRRIRCARINQTETCEACRTSNVVCNSTSPRKRAFSAGNDTNDRRRKALDALVRGMFPNEDCDDVSTLVRLGIQRNIAMPDPDQPSTASHTAGSIQSQTPDGMHSAIAVPSRNTGASPLQSYAETASSVTQIPESSVLADVPWPYNIDPVVQGAVTDLREETCIRAPHGVAHYVGPASSFEFANTVRRLVALRSELCHDSDSRHDQRSNLRAEFTNLQTSIALEPRIRTHPASSVRESNTDGYATHSSSTLPGNQKQVNGDKGDIQPHCTCTPNSLRTQMPTRELAERLIKAFFDRLHPNYPLFHRGTFHTQFETIWQRSSSLSTDHDPGWLCSLLMVYVFGAQLLEHEGLEDATRIQRRLLRLVRERFDRLALTANLANVQALLLLQLYEHNAGERNTSWILLGQAARMAIALGMHREGTVHNFDVIERNTRKMIWFTLYSFEQYASLALGRPSAIKALEVNIRLPDEAMTDGYDHPPDYFTHASRLVELTSKVRHFATASSPNCFNDQFLVSMLDSVAIINQELRNWCQCLPQHLRPEWSHSRTQHLRAVLLLHINYHYIVSVLNRPYLLCKADHDIKQRSLLSPNAAAASTAGPEIARLAQLCVTSSIHVAEMLHRLASASLLEGSGWIDFFYLYHAMLAMCLEFLGRPHQSAEDWTDQDHEISANVSMLLEMRQTHRLAPTFHILSKVAIQFAHIVGLARDYGPSRADSERLPGTQAVDKLPYGQESNDITHPSGSVATRQPDVFMPFAEPISGISQFTDNNVYWDFFNVNGVDPMDTSMQYAAGTFQDTFSDAMWYGQTNNWSL